MRAMCLALILIVDMTVTGCAPANIVSSRWETGLNGANIETRCEEVDMRSNSDMNKVFAKYDGWKLIYISEYTTGNRIGTDAAVCFEHAK